MAYIIAFWGFFPLYFIFRFVVTQILIKRQYKARIKLNIVFRFLLFFPIFAPVKYTHSKYTEPAYKFTVWAIVLQLLLLVGISANILRFVFIGVEYSSGIFTLINLCVFVGLIWYLIYIWKGGGGTVLNVATMDPISMQKGVSHVKDPYTITELSNREMIIRYKSVITEYELALQYELGFSKQGFNTVSFETIKNVYEYLENEVGLVTKVIDSNNNASVYTFSKTKRNMLLSRELPNGIKQTYDYNIDGSISEIKVLSPTGSVIALYKYTRERDNKIISVEELNRQIDFKYDTESRLLQETYNGTVNVDITYSYDNEGNRLEKVHNGNKKVYEYSDENILSSEMYNGITIFYSYDLNNNLISQKATDKHSLYYLYNSPSMDVLFDYSRSHRTSVSTRSRLNNALTGSSKSTLTGTGNESFKYDKRGCIAWKMDSYGWKTTYVTDYIHDNTTLAELDYDGNIVASYVHYCDNPMQNSKFMPSHVVSQTRLNKTSYYIYDGFGSVRMLTDSNGNITDTYDYDSFGNILHRTGNTRNEYLFAGKRYDPFTGLYLFITVVGPKHDLRSIPRFMNPKTGLYLTTNTNFWRNRLHLSSPAYDEIISERVGNNYYRFANQNPVSIIDDAYGSKTTQRVY